MIGYYFVTDKKLSKKGITSDVKAAVAAGVKCVQYRNKEADAEKAYAEALQLKRICKDITFLINDRLDLALRVGADGVHLGQDDLPVAMARRLLGEKKIIGLTVHSIKEAQEAKKQGVDYIAVSPIYATKTKRDAGKPKGIALIKKIKKNVKLPVVAIGGVNLSNARKVIRAGADGLCAISCVVSKPDVRKEIARFQKIFHKWKRPFPS
jgi:thiamine-phosphate pyrophosphorylase